jgi:hypothetical protein
MRLTVQLFSRKIAHARDACIQTNIQSEDSMGLRQALTGGHLCIDLTNIEMSPSDQQELLAAVQTTVVTYLSQRSEAAKVVTISMAPNNGTIAPSAGAPRASLS